MAEENGNNGGQPAGGAAQGAAAQPAPQNLGVLAQYVKDLSFESPGAPQSLRDRGTAPNINITINVEPGEVVNNEVEVELKVDAQAKVGENVLFAIELSYGGLFRLTNIPPEAVQPILRIECPRLLFPFARQILADASRNGGFPPLLIDPIDFLALYRQRLAQAQAAAKPAPDQIA
ncbi:MAG: protein-export chaperone SecB [Bauldia litoralis]